jgi:hypothetical protein
MPGRRRGVDVVVAVRVRVMRPFDSLKRDSIVGTDAIRAAIIADLGVGVPLNSSPARTGPSVTGRASTHIAFRDRAISMVR